MLHLFHCIASCHWYGLSGKRTKQCVRYHCDLTAWSISWTSRKSALCSCRTVSTGSFLHIVHVRLHLVQITDYIVTCLLIFPIYLLIVWKDRVELFSLCILSPRHTFFVGMASLCEFWSYGWVFGRDDGIAWYVSIPEAFEKRVIKSAQVM